MPRVHFVKAARKNNPVAKKGESYYWWQPMVGGRGGAKRYSKERPRPSQVTQSEYLSACYSAQESVEDSLSNFIAGKCELADLIGDLESAADEVRQAGEDCDEKYNNMPDGLQQGDTGQMLEQRRDAAESLADEIESAKGEVEDFDDAEAQKEEDWKESVQSIVEGIGWDFGE